MKNLNNELIEKAKQANNADEILSLAKQNGIELDEEQAKAYYAQLHPTSGELSDDELDNVAGGGCGGESKTYPEVGQTIRVGGGFKCTSCGALEGTVLSVYINTGKSVSMGVRCNACGNSYTILADCKNAYTIL